MPKVGRPLSTEQTRLLITLICALANSGDAIVLSSIIARLGISEEEARSIIDGLVNLGAISPSFSVAELDGTEGVEIPKTMGSHGKVLRLTPSETLAVDSAFKRLGSFDDDPLRQSVLSALASPAVSEKDYERVTHQWSNADVLDRVMKCSQALFYGTGLRFLYQGSSDDAPRLRRVQPFTLSENGGFWYLEAADAEEGAHRSFRLDRMEDIEEDLEVGGLTLEEEPEREVELEFSSTKMLDLLEWPRLRLLGNPGDVPVRASIPYYGGLWLVRRLAACGSSVKIADPELAQAVRDYAAQQLSALNEQ